VEVGRNLALFRWPLFCLHLPLFCLTCIVWGAVAGPQTPPSLVQWCCSVVLVRRCWCRCSAAAVPAYRAASCAGGPPTHSGLVTYQCAHSNRQFAWGWMGWLGAPAQVARQNINTRFSSSKPHQTLPLSRITPSTLHFATSPTPRHQHSTSIPIFSPFSLRPPRLHIHKRHPP
jgi:hypothetical protein